MPITYDPISTTTLSSATSSITFSSIPATYTDLRIVLNLVSNATQYMQLDFNGDTGTNYSETWIDASPSARATSRTANSNYIDLSQRTANSGTVTFYAIDIFAYAGSTFKTCLQESNQNYNGSGFVSRQVGMWRSTSAITSIRLNSGASIYGVGTTATLYGIKNA
jgi:hypothetical protein